MNQALIRFSSLARSSLLAVAFAACLCASSCAVEETRSGLPPEAQATIDRITEEIATGQLDKIYAEAAEEWRQAATPEQSRQALETLRARLGRVAARNFLTGRVQRNTGGELPGQSLVVTYQTKFETGAGMETFTLVERDGQWLLARYFVNSDALR